MKTTVAAALAVGALTAAVPAGAATTRPTDVTDLTLTISKAKLIVETLAPNGVEVSGTDPVLGGKPVQVAGTITRDGKTLRVAPAGFIFPVLPVPLDKVGVKDVSIDLIQSKQAAGTIDPASGRVTMPLSLAIQLRSPSLGLNCLIKGFDVTFGTGTVTVGTGTSAPKLTGAVLNKQTNSLTLVGAAKIPDASKIPTSECDVVSRLVASGLSGKSLGLSITGNSVVGTSYRIPAAASLTSTRVAFSSKRATVPVTCVGSGAANRACAGTLSLTVNTSTPFTLTANWAAAAGRTASATFTLTDTQRSAIRNHRVSGRLTTPTGKLLAVTDNGSDASKALTGVTSN